MASQANQRTPATANYQRPPALPAAIETTAGSATTTFGDGEIAQVMDVTGELADGCKNYLRLANGNVETAIGLALQTSTKEKENNAYLRYMQNRSSESSLHGLKRTRNGEPLQSLPSLYSMPTGSQSVGLRNLGNTCFMNAVMQVICSLREFVADLSSFASDLPSGITCPILEATLQVVRHMHNSSTSCGPLDTTTLRTRIARVCLKFGDGRQHDAHEFFVEFVEKLHAEMRRAVEASAPNAEDAQTRQLATGKHLHSQILKQLTCSKCRARHSLREDFSHLSVDLEGSGELVLENMLSAYFANENVSVRCEKCQGEESTMEKSLAAPPQVLVLHLKRFHQDPLFKGLYKKLNHRIKFPTALDLKRICKRQVNVDASQEDSVQEVSTGSDESVWYDLRSVIVHEGSTPQSGHYVAYACSSKGVWRLYNDSSVREVASTETLGLEAYMLIYQRRAAAAA